jgi:NRPS condensation-like uncharacterized protein
MEIPLRANALVKFAAKYKLKHKAKITKMEVSNCISFRKYCRLFLIVEKKLIPLK